MRNPGNEARNAVPAAETERTGNEQPGPDGKISVRIALAAVRTTVVVQVRHLVEDGSHCSLPFTTIYVQLSSRMLALFMPVLS